MSIIPCVAWVKKGKAKSKPEKLQLAKEDLKRIIEDTQERLDEGEESEDEETENTKPVAAGSVKIEDLEEESDTDVDSEVAHARAFAKTLKGSKVKKEREGATGGQDDFESRYHMEDYDKEKSDWSNPFRGIGGLTVYSSNDDDPYVTLKNEGDSDDEDFEIKSTDNLMLVARVEAELCSVEVHVYNAELQNLYVHHDILLSSFPLALEWMDYDLRDGNAGSFVAISTMDPTIDIWDLDLVDCLEPLATLGEKVTKRKKKGGPIGHTDAVLDLSWNPIVRHVLASASADNTVGLWDLTEGIIAMSLKQHKDKVQCVKWHPVEEHLLLSGSFDKSVKMYDCRTPDTNHKTWNLSGEIEKLLWNTFSPLNFFASTDTGHVFYMDSRHDKPVYTLSAHTESVTGLCMSSEDPRLLVTSSTDHTVKIWDIEGDKPSLVHSHDIKLGQLHSMGNCPDAPYVFAIGGEKDVKVWDLRDNRDVFKHFCQPGGNVEEQSEEQNDNIDDSGVAMETPENDIVMETETTSQEASTDDVKTKKKKKKKKKKPKNT